MTVTSLGDLLATLNFSLQSATASLPELSDVTHSTDGISLLDTKNAFLLSYIQNLVFLILIKLRDVSSSHSHVGSTFIGQDGDHSRDMRAEIVKKLVELRIYLEKGVKPLEGRLRYQIEKVIRAANDEAAKESAPKIQHRKLNPNGTLKPDGRQTILGSENDSDEDNTNSSDDSSRSIDPLAYRPNPSTLTLPSRSQPSDSTSTSKTNGLYRPPRITPTSLPTTTPVARTAQRRPTKSATLDEFISTELSGAPTAEPSIGSTIVDRGRHSKSAKERESERERRGYEESNYTRLPVEAKTKGKGRGGREGMQGYGGEEWRGLGEGAERVAQLVRKGTGGRKGVGGALERSRKRGREDGGGGFGNGEARIGERFEKRLKGLERRRGR
ncbi:hypothetical protein MMC19_002907 [Ptychographa xylographoides]|nr:hypothetical protein [Ptychographa xylographoides]